MALLFGVAGCSGSDIHSTASDGGAESLTVEVARPEADPIGSLFVPGRVKAREEITLTARVSARLTALPIREGDRFAKNAVLARFDAPETQDAVRSARQGVLAAESRMKHATSDESRMRKLFESRVVAARDLELAELELASAQAALADARAELQRWEESTAITAPFGGVVARRHVDPGQTVAPGDPLLDLRTSEVGEIEAAIPESALPWLESAQVHYQMADQPWQPARLERVDGMTDYATRTRVARFAPIRSQGLEPGAFTRLRLVRTHAGETGAVTAGLAPVTIPTGALVFRGALTGVYVVRDGRAWLRWLRVGHESDGRIEVLAGLSTDETVVLDTKGLHDGRAVRVHQ
jgi:RND family efflux transporter MFP subunit